MSEDTPKCGMGKPDYEKENMEKMAQFNRAETQEVAR